MRKQSVIQIVVYACFLLFLFAGSVTSHGMSSLHLTDQWFYVGGSGLGNYSKIQEALDVAQDGDTVFVYDDNSPYTESLTINNSIHLIGEQKETTVIMWGHQFVIDVYADEVLVTGFTIYCFERSFGIFLYGNESTVRGNIFENGSDGILINSKNNLISHNQFHDGGVSLITTFHNNISFNTISGCNPAIGLWGLNAENTFYMNNITGNVMGVILEMSSRNTFLCNNFIDNSKQARFARGIPIEILGKIKLIFSHFSSNTFQLGLFYRVLGLNQWDGNYWDGSELSPYPIFGRRGYPGLFTIDNTLFLPTMINFDWHPVQEPYDISGIN
jgi:parallel beta-helix repeat protein